MAKITSLISSLGSKFTAATLPVQVAVVTGGTLVAAGSIYGGVQVVETIVEQQKAQSEIVLLQEEMSFEYGMEIPNDITSYINTDKTDPELIKNATLDLSDLVEKDGFVAVGDYEIVLNANGKEYVIKVNVSDTVAPTWKDGVTKIETEVDQIPDYASYFSAEDGSGVEISFDDSNINYATAGSYLLKVTAKDPYGNEAVLEDIEVVVTEKEVAQKPQEPTTPSQPEQTPTKPEEKPQEETPAPQPETPAEPEPAPEEEEKEPNNFPYTLYELTTYQGHYGFFTNGNSGKESALVPHLYPEGGMGKEFLVGYFDDVGGVSFLYNDDNPNNPLKPKQ